VSAGLQLEVHQDSNTPADVFVRAASSGRAARLLELNPQFQELSLGHVESFDWQDGAGHRFHGGLFFPPDYLPGKRLPVVLQTYGFRDDEFQVDGPMSMKTGFAARALINQGMLVLQTPELAYASPESPGGFEPADENALALAGLEAAIDALDARGLIDTSKVGLAGFSREGTHVQYAVTFTSRPIAAAIISDSATATPFCYALIHGAPRPGLVEFERNGLIGATPWGKGMNLWLERSPAFHYERIRTPLRVEFINYCVPCTWDMYAMLSRHRRPIELVHIPRESHNLQTPWGRYTSQQGAVDWFNFWLRDIEDPDPAKQAQYRRWRVFREQQATANAARESSRVQVTK
jgi:dipeptidyl aminopeptidase/acylaminoacyl peptidase